MTRSAEDDGLVGGRPDYEWLKDGIHPRKGDRYANGKWDDPRSVVWDYEILSTPNENDNSAIVRFRMQHGTSGVTLAAIAKDTFISSQEDRDVAAGKAVADSVSSAAIIFGKTFSVGGKEVRDASSGTITVTAKTQAEAETLVRTEIEKFVGSVWYTIDLHSQALRTQNMQGDTLTISWETKAEWRCVG